MTPFPDAPSPTPRDSPDVSAASDVAHRGITRPVSHRWRASVTLELSLWVFALLAAWLSGLPGQQLRPLNSLAVAPLAVDPLAVGPSPTDSRAAHGPAGDTMATESPEAWSTTLLAASGIGLVATVPPLVAMGLLYRLRAGFVRRLRRFLEDVVVPFFHDFSWWQLALVALAAGVGEEYLFRGWLQQWLSTWSTPQIAIALAALAFGVAHPVSPSYVVLATAMGVYFGWLFLITGHLLVPVLTHALYDLVVLVYLVRRARLGRLAVSIQGTRGERWATKNQPREP